MSSYFYPKFTTFTLSDIFFLRSIFLKDKFTDFFFLLILYVLFTALPFLGLFFRCLFFQWNGWNESRISFLKIVEDFFSSNFIFCLPFWAVLPRPQENCLPRVLPNIGRQNRVGIVLLQPKDKIPTCWNNNFEWMLNECNLVSVPVFC